MTTKTDTFFRNLAAISKAYDAEIVVTENRVEALRGHAVIALAEGEEETSGALDDRADALESNLRELRDGHPDHYFDLQETDR